MTGRRARVVNVRAYGAVGDGVSDDTAAIRAAASACRAGDTLYFPPGTWISRISDSSERSTSKDLGTRK